ncbi:MAG TPA: hypothetical protein VFU65_17205 [Actinocrinis sp.]|nr:hypothetical protein [Actinocrinis sp.]
MSLARWFRRLGPAVAAAALATLSLAAAPPASAATISTSLGPIPVPSVPLSVCVNSTCVSTPAATSITLSATVSANGITVPVVEPGSCPAGSIGAAFTANTLTAATVTISGSLSGTGVNGQPFNIPIGPYSQTLGTGTPGIAVSACTT